VVAPPFAAVANALCLNSYKNAHAGKRVSRLRPPPRTDIPGPTLPMASQESTYMTGQTLHIDGGMFVGS
jgi:NAD(P)-dependent dehydrogenase (short-subunit alcohol dehydrogenase family)